METRAVQVRLSEDDFNKLSTIAHGIGAPMGVALRMLIRQFGGLKIDGPAQTNGGCHDARRGHG